MATIKPQTKATKALIALCGAAALAVVLMAYHLLGWALSTQKRLSCNTPRTVSTQTEYCVYHTASGFFGGTNTVLVGPSASRGIVYGVPYPAQDIRVEWDSHGGTVTLHMPGTKLAISATEYIDTR